MIKQKKKAQIELGNAPSVVLIVGLLFLTMATVAFISQNYGSALDTDNVAATVTNESLTKASLVAGATLNGNNMLNGHCGDITDFRNATAGDSISVGNLTQGDCYVINASTLEGRETSYVVSYPYTYSQGTVASNSTDDLETNISENTSIAGIILTISLVGIVLTILIGVFVGMRRPRI